MLSGLAVPNDWDLDAREPARNHERTRLSRSRRVFDDVKEKLTDGSLITNIFSQSE